MALDYSIIGERLKRARLAKNMTQENLAEQLDVSVAFLSRVERGHSHLNLARQTLASPQNGRHTSAQALLPSCLRRPTHRPCYAENAVQETNIEARKETFRCPAPPRQPPSRHG